MSPVKATLILLITVAIGPVVAAEAEWSATGGQSSWQLSARALANLGLTLDAAGERRRPAGVREFRRSFSSRGAIAFDGSGASFNRLLGGSLELASGFGLRGPAGSLDFDGLTIKPLAGVREAAFAGVLVNGTVALTLRYGHFDYRPQADRLDVHIMDAYAGPALATLLGSQSIEGVYLGQVTFELEVVTTGATFSEPKGTVCGPAPNWPTLAGFDADLEMLAMDQIVETPTSRAGGRIAITPSAFFANSGSADIPWYSMFTTPANDSDCLDDGTGQCQPYGRDQGGLLVWNLYRLRDGRLEQLGRSAVKHAWNSVNQSCACPSGRVVGAGCTDRYTTGNNADQNVLGPRAEVDANAVIWNKVGSIWDSNGDGQCDAANPAGFPHSESWCLSNPADEFEGRLALLDSQLLDGNAQYFIESWYLVRQDIDIFNSMGFQQIRPTFDAGAGATGIWSFPCVGGGCATTFQQGPALSNFVDPAAPITLEGVAQTSATHDAGQGRVRLASQVTAIDAGRSRYQFSLMNFDFDRRIDSFSVALPPFARVTNTYVLDGGDPATSWSATVSVDQVSFTAVTGALDWGSLVSFGFDAALPATNASAQLGVDETGSPASFTLDTLAPLDDVLLVDGFES